jgi:hypothetical protein
LTADRHADRQEKSVPDEPTIEEGQNMIALLVLAAFIVFIEVAALRGWGSDSRDGRDWTVGNPPRGAHGAVHPPASWLK